MKKMLPASLLSLCLVATAGACRTNEMLHAQAKDVATDLTPAGAGSGVRLYYTDTSNVYELGCQIGLPPVRSNCTAGKRAVPYAKFSAVLAGDIEQRRAAAEPKVPPLEADFNAKNGTLKAALAMSADLSAQKQTAVAGADGLKGQLAAAATTSQGLQAQIDGTEQTLAAQQNSDLSAQMAQIKTELKALQEKQTELSQQYQAQAAAAAADDAKIAALGDLSAAQNQVFQAAKVLAEAKNVLDGIKAEGAGLSEALAKLKEDLSYDASSGDTNFPKMRPFAARFQIVFDQILAPAPPPPPAPPPGPSQLSLQDGTYQCPYFLMMVKGAAAGHSFSITETVLPYGVKCTFKCLDDGSGLCKATSNASGCATLHIKSATQYQRDDSWAETCTRNGDIPDPAHYCHQHWYCDANGCFWQQLPGPGDPGDPGC